MAFNDIEVLSYAEMDHIAATQAPYRALTGQKAWPLGDRRHSARHFRMEMEEGSNDPVYVVYYAHREYTDSILDSGVEPEKLKRAKLLKLRSDDTIELLEAQYGQGERQLLSAMTCAYVSNDCKRGGTVITRGPGWVVPAFVGLRINVNTMKVHGDLVVEKRRVNTDVSRAILAPYAEKLRAVCVMVSSMQEDGLAEAIEDVMVNHRIKLSEFEKRIKLFDTAMFDAALLSIKPEALGRIHWAMEANLSFREAWQQQYLVRAAREIHKAARDPDTVVSRFAKTLYFARPEVFKHARVNAASLPVSQWGYRITYNGEPVKRIGYGITPY